MQKKSSDARIRANNKYKRKAYEPLRIDVNRNERLNELIDFARQLTHKSKAQYVVDAIKNQLDKDGVTIEQLSPIADDDNQE